MTDTLAQVAADLRYAATTGAARLAAGVVASARVHAQVGQAVRNSGPGVAQLLHKSGAATADAGESSVPVGELADLMANQLAEGGAQLAVGKRR